MLYYQIFTDVLFEILSLYQLLRADIEYKGAVRRMQYPFNLVDADVAVRGGFLDNQCHFQTNRDFFCFCGYIGILLPSAVKNAYERDAAGDFFLQNLP